MATVYLGENAVHTIGALPTKGQPAPAATLVANDLSAHTIAQYQGQQLILNIFPSIDTPTCATSVRKFNIEAAAIPNTKVLCISKDLPFAMKRFCAAEGIDHVITMSDFRTGQFGERYGVTMQDGVLAGLHARAIVVINEHGEIVYTELVGKIGDEPNYAAALEAIQ